MNEEKRNKFKEVAGKRVTNILHDLSILEPMAKSSAYDYSKQDVTKMFGAMKNKLDIVESKFIEKLEKKEKEVKVAEFSFDDDEDYVDDEEEDTKEDYDTEQDLDVE